MDFILGCNYWASNAGAEMWKDFDSEVIKNDLEVLAKHGVNCLRVFPNWRDFQPVIPIYGGKATFIKYCLENDREATNPYYLDETMLDRFSLLLDECEKHNVKVIVGLITGFMSGRLYIPSALYGKNIITDPVALYFQQLFIKGFVSQFKNRDIIYGWDLGNECNVMGPVENRYQAVNWIAGIANAIRAEDNTRPIISGMHGLSVEGNWRINDNALFTDMLTTHPYPFWCEHTRIDKTMSYRTILHPTAQTKYYAEIGKKDCLAEELGTMGPSICSEESAADFLRINTFSLFANGAKGVMWWCAFDQDKLEKYPYAIEMVERELGMLDGDSQPKPVLKELKKLADILKGKSLPIAETDAVCLLTKEQRQWGVGYMAYGLMRKIGLNCSFEFVENDLPQANVYMLPSVKGTHICEKRKLKQLLQNVSEGATLYISTDNAIISSFNEIVGLKVIDSCETTIKRNLSVAGKSLPYIKTRNILLEAMQAEVLLYDSENNPMLTVNKYGKGKIIYLNFSLENYLIDVPEAFDKGYEKLYELIFKETLDKCIIKIENDNIVYTVHKKENDIIVVVLNYSEKEQSLVLKTNPDYVLTDCLYGKIDKIKAWDGCVLLLTKTKNRRSL